MRKTMRNIEKVVGKKERAAWRAITYCKGKYGKDSVEHQKALAEWAALAYVKFMFESDDAFNLAWEIWMTEETR